ncbi:MAG: VOC family protein [Patescibacteria group bacterium]|mgnify:CR=1 FL=1
MFENISTVLIWSEDFRKLADWYREKLNLKVVEELNHPQDTGVLFEFEKGGAWLWIGQHSEVHGKNKDKSRHMFNITVASVEETYTALLAKGVKFLATPFKAPTFDKYFATFYDLDENLIQVIGDK